MTDVGLGGFPPVVTVTATEESLLPSADGHHRVWTALQVVSRPLGLDLNVHHRTNKTQALTHGVIGIN